MSNRVPVAFDIETSGLGDEAVVTVAGFAHELGAVQVLNADGRDADSDALVDALNAAGEGRVQLTVTDDERGLLEELASVATERVDGDTHYLTAFNGETWRGGFDLPFCRTRYLRHGLDWPFGEVAYADMLQVVDRFETGDHGDLVGVYDVLVGRETCDPFADSAEAVAAFDRGEWEALLLHNLADVQRTRRLALLAGEFVPRSDFGMKNLEPPGR